MSILIVLVIGAVAGWLGSQIWSGSSFGLIGNIVIGILGSFIGHWLIGERLGTGIVGSILTGALGAIVILAILNIILGSTNKT